MNKLLANVAILFSLLSGCVTDYAVVSPKEYIDREVIVEVTVKDTGDDGWQGEVWVDHFFQSSTMNGIDILWIIDRSGSMNTHRDRVINGIEQMIISLNSFSVDTRWRLAIISTDSSKAALENQFPLTYGSSVDDVLIMYNNISGTREEGFDASYEYIINNSYAATWMRNTAALLIVFVSDEEEDGDLFNDGAEYMNWLLALGRPQVHLASIVNLPLEDSLCNTNPSYVGEKYMQATQLASGIIIDICSEDWTSGVGSVADQLEPVIEHKLTHIPIQESIEVFVSGIPYDSTKWYYEPSLNSIIFTETNSMGEVVGPPPASLVEIAYVYEESQEDTG